MAKPKRKTKTTRPRVNLPPCAFCAKDKNPDYKDWEELSKYLTDRARILGSKYSGVCSRHQRMLTLSIKRARDLGLLPITPAL